MKKTSARGFDMAMRTQQEWGALFSLWLFLSGTGSVLFLLFELLGLPPVFGLLSLAVVVAGGVLLLFELGNPLRAWRSVARLRTSWLSRGALSVALFLVCGALSVAPSFAVFSWLPWNEQSIVGKLLGWAALLCALLVSIYPGFFLANNRSVPFWNTRLFAVMSWGFAVMGACGLALLAWPAALAGVERLEWLAAIVILVNLVMLVVHLLGMARAGGAAGESVRLLNHAPLSTMLHIGVVLVGMVLPLVAMVWFPSALALAGAGMLIGTLALRCCVVMAAVYVPPQLAEQGFDLGTLKRPSEQLRQEYAAASARR
jgi:formate-dependent nitrite reductase membrane component NrfD